MSFLNKVFGNKKSSEKVPTLPEAIQKLKQTEEMLLKKQNYLETKIAKEVATAKQNATKNKKAAIQALKRKKQYESQLVRIDGTLTTIETQRDALESANANTAVLSSMQNASEALKAAQKYMNVDKVDEMLGDLTDQREIADEISNAICQPVPTEYDEDLDELEKELQELELGSFTSDVLPHKLPPVPLDDIQSSKNKTPVKKGTKEAAAVAVLSK